MMHRIPTPWHLWLVAVLALLWNAMGALDFSMTVSQNEQYLAGYSQQQLDYFLGFPGWVVLMWGISVWGSVLASLFLLLRKSWAVEIYTLCFITMLLTTLYNFGLSNGLEIMGDTFSLVFSAVIFIVALLLPLYSRAMRKRRILG